jgi:hypothetical protein
MNFEIAFQQKDNLNIEKFLFPNGLPKFIDELRVRTSEKLANKDHKFYVIDSISPDRIKSHILSYSKKSDKDNFVKYMAFLFWNILDGDTKDYPLISLYINDKDEKYEIAVSNSRLSISDLYSIFGDNYKFSKSFIKSVIGNLETKPEDKPALMKLMKENRVEIYRILSKIQFSKLELMEIIKYKSFNSKTHSGTFGNLERLDIANKRSIILYQNEVDSEIFMEIFNEIEPGDSYAKESLLKGLKRNLVKEKFKDSPEILLLAKLM